MAAFGYSPHKSDAHRSSDPVALGLVESLARPGGNVTGVSFLAERLNGKLLQLLKEAVPRASRVAVLWNPANGTHAGYLVIITIGTAAVACFAALIAPQALLHE